MNFQVKEKEILALADYFTTLRPGDGEVLFGPNGSRYTISIGPPGWAVLEARPFNAAHDMKLNSSRMNEFLKNLNWTNSNVLTLKKMLMEANCKYVSSDGDTIHLHFGTGDICSFWYIISQKPFADSTIRKQTEAGVTFLKRKVRIGSSCAL